jgi:hypothetical protein
MQDSTDVLGQTVRGVGGIDGRGQGIGGQPIRQRFRDQLVVEPRLTHRSDRRCWV